MKPTPEQIHAQRTQAAGERLQRSLQNAPTLAAQQAAMTNYRFAITAIDAALEAAQRGLAA
jgi:hypothetical protein